jgi:ornithine cyclodeaminase
MTTAARARGDGIDTVTLPVLTAEQITALVSPADAVDAIEAAVRDADPAGDPARSVVDVEHGALLLMPSSNSAAVGVKLVTVGQPGSSPRVQGVYVLFDAETLAPTAILDGAALTTLRTPAVSIAAVKPALLRRTTAPRVFVFGVGPQGTGHADMLTAMFDVADLAYVVRKPRGGERTYQAGSTEVEALLRAADVVVCATTARTPLFDSALLADGAVVIAVGAHEPDARELDSGLMARAQVVVEDVATALRECGDVVLAVEDGSLDTDALVPLRDVVTGAVPPAEDGPVVFKGSGMAWQDLAVAARVYAAFTG